MSRTSARPPRPRPGVLPAPFVTFVAFVAVVALTAAVVGLACDRPSDASAGTDADSGRAGIARADAASVAVAASGGSDDHAGYLAAVEGVRLEIVEPGTEGAWREIRGAGRVVRLHSPPERIASRTLGTDEILLEIAEPERIALLSPFADDPRYSHSAEQARRLGRVGGASTEEILAAAPDLVLAAGFNRQETLARIEATGVPVVVLMDHGSLASLQENIRVVGFAIGRDREAARLVDAMQERLAAARSRVGGRARGLRVVHWNGGTVTARETLFDDAVRYLGAVNLATEKGLSGWPRVSAEQLVVWRPDVVFTDTRAKDGLVAGVLDETRTGAPRRVEHLGGRDMATVSHHVTAMVDLLADALVRAAEGMETRVDTPAGPAAEPSGDPASRTGK